MAPSWNLPLTPGQRFGKVLSTWDRQLKHGRSSSSPRSSSRIGEPNGLLLTLLAMQPPFCRAKAFPGRCPRTRRARLWPRTLAKNWRMAIGAESSSVWKTLLIPMPVSAYDPARAPICVSLGPGGSPVRETWELVNLATESHNFHIHQAKFRVVDAAALAQTLQSASDSAVVVEDNVPVPFAVANSGNIADN